MRLLSQSTAREGAHCVRRAFSSSPASLPDVKVVGVLGAGQMGSGIAQVAAMSDLEVILVDSNSSALQRGLESIRFSLSRFLKHGTLKSEDELNSILSRIKLSESYHHLADAQFVVEAIIEDEAIKKRAFAELDNATPLSTILGSNTSSISITKLAAATKRPELVVGMHFMNPPPIMQLIEIVRGENTRQDVYETTVSLARRFKKEICISQDFPGFIVNRILLPMINEAFYTLMEGVASRECIDTGMKLGTNQPMGPLALADLIGLDTCLSILRVLHSSFGDSKYRPCPLLVRYVDGGRLGRKVGRGVYDYPSRPV